MRAPTTSAAASAEKPEPISTGTPPAKSSVPLRLQPAAAEGPVRQHGVHETDQSAAKTRNGPKRIRSTTAPDTSAVVMMQNVAWKAKKTRCGIVVPSRGAKATSCRKAWSRPPIDAPSPSNASE